MAEIKNSFLGAKMNKDIDDRILSPNEYRDAVNVQVSKSENSDVGSLQTVFGNELVVDFNALEETTGLDCVGYYSDINNNRAFLFLTNHNNEAYSPDAENYIYVYNAGLPVSVNNPQKLVQGAFLNFSKSAPIIGINLLEDLLFWTDNRNQPRKINIINAINDINYYTTEDQISVAKINPYQPIQLWQESELSPENYETTMKDVSSRYYPDGGEAFTNGATGILSAFPIDGIIGVITPGVDVGRIDAVTGEIIPLGLTVVSYDEGTTELTLSGAPDLDDNTNLVFSINPYYDPIFPGDQDYLKDKFVRFSYRFKFDDGEYSILAPFTQIAFIPKQDGYFLYNEDYDINDENDTYRSTIVSFMENKVTQVRLIIPLPEEKSELMSKLKITEIDILYKESDSLAVKVVESIPVDIIEEDTVGDANHYVYDYNSKKPYKTLPNDETVRVFDKVPVKALAQEIISNRVVYGNYQDKHTPLPGDTSLNYNVAISTKYDFNITDFNFTSYIEYPNHSLKQNRGYQVGVVLSDKYGRQSTVLLPGNNNTIIVDGQAFSGSTVYTPYISNLINITEWPGQSLKVVFNDLIPVSPDVDSKYPGVYNGDANSVDYNPLGWYSYKIVVKQTQQDYYNVYLPNVMAAYPDDTNKELGKTSHIALINDNINKVPRDLAEVGPTQKQFRSSVRLYGRVDVLVPEISPSYPKNFQYYPGKDSMVASTIADNLSLFNGDGTISGYTPSPLFYNINSNPLIGRISTQQQFGIPATYYDPLFEDILWNLAVVETAPTESALDIFWETSTAGSIIELNAAIEANSGGAVNLGTWNTSGFNEGVGIGYNVAGTEFALVDEAGFAINNYPQIITSFTMTVANQGAFGGDVTSYFLLEDVPGHTIADEFPRWTIKTTSDFYDNVYFRGTSVPGLDNFVFTFTATVEGLDRILSRTVILDNVDPIIDNAPEPGEIATATPLDTEMIRIRGRNGCANPELSTDPPISWSLLSATTLGGSPVNYFNVTNSIESISPGEPYAYGTLNNNYGGSGVIPIGPYNITMRLTDAGGAGDATNTTFTLRLGFVPIFVSEYTFSTAAGGRTEYFVIIQVPSDADPYTPGYYAFKGSWADLLSFNTDVVLIHPTDYGCLYDWMYSSVYDRVFLEEVAVCIDGTYDPVIDGLPVATPISVGSVKFSFGIYP